jgi:hypothetical protein
MTDPAFKNSRTPLGQTLRALRAKYIRGGGRLFTAEEIEEELMTEPMQGKQMWTKEKILRLRDLIEIEEYSSLTHAEKSELEDLHRQRIEYRCSVQDAEHDRKEPQT